MRRPASRALWAVALSGGLLGCSQGASSGASSGPTAAPPASAPTSGLVSLPASGRILFVIEGPAPNEPVYLDKAGIHPIPVADSTLAHATWASSSSIIFDSERTAGRHLYKAGLDGANVVQLSSGPAFQERASLSGDGSLMAYDDYLDATGQDLGLHVAQADGTHARAVTPGGAAAALGGDTWATISPDGQWIAFERGVNFDAGKAGLFVMRIDGTGLRRLTDDTTDAAYPRWSPDGKRILFTEHYDGNFSPGPLWVVNVAGGAPVPLTSPTDPGWAFEGDWSPDGTQIVYKYYLTGWDHNELRLANVDGTHEQTLWIGPDGTTAETPDWAP
jgi:Tol biopolymer transport system component